MSMSLARLREYKVNYRLLEAALVPQRTVGRSRLDAEAKLIRTQQQQHNKQGRYAQPGGPRKASIAALYRPNRHPIGHEERSSCLRGKAH